MTSQRDVDVDGKCCLLSSLRGSRGQIGASNHHTGSIAFRALGIFRAGAVILNL